MDRGSAGRDLMRHGYHIPVLWHCPRCMRWATAYSVTAIGVVSVFGTRLYPVSAARTLCKHWVQLPGAVPD